jgi:gamma-glutamyltranspeptidase/glutathione hydrolase
MMLAKGGNAVDAVVAAYFALSVVEPQMSSPFGSGFVNLYTADGRSIVLDNSAAAPGDSTPAMYDLLHPEDERLQAETDHEVVGHANDTGFRSIGIPGNLKAWLWLLRNHGSGTLRLRDILAPAIDFARNGVRVSQGVADDIRDSLERCKPFAGWSEQFLPEGRAPEVGSWLSRPSYARTLEALASAGTGSEIPEIEAAGARFYRGDIARNVVRHVRENGGILSMDDLAWYWGGGLSDLSERQGLRLRTAVRGTYRGYHVLAIPPTSSGGTHIVEILNILEGFDLRSSGFGTTRTLHLMTEAMKIAWADRDLYMGDPEYAYRDPSYRYAPPPVERIIDKSYAAERRKQIDPARAGTYAPGQFGEIPPSIGRGGFEESRNTTNATAMDSEGNVITMTQTLNHLFGSCVAVPGDEPGGGLLLNNNMALFDPDPRPGYERANAIAPRKRMLSSMSPTIVLREGKPYFALGTPGGTRIYATVLQGIVNVIDHGMGIQQSVESPRIWTRMFGDAEVEEGFPEEITAALKELGHGVKRVRAVAGGMNGVLRDPETGLLHGGACWRADGSVAGWSGGDALPTSSKFPPEWEGRRSSAR